MSILNNENMSHNTRTMLFLLGSYVALGIAFFGIADNAQLAICNLPGFNITPVITMDIVGSSFFIALALLVLAIYTAWEVRWQDKHKFMATFASYCAFVLVLVLFVCSVTGVSPVEIIEAFFGDPHAGKIYTLDYPTSSAPRFCHVRNGSL